MKIIKTKRVEFTKEDKELFEKAYHMAHEICNEFNEDECESCPFYEYCGERSIVDVMGDVYEAIDEYEYWLNYSED